MQPSPTACAPTVTLADSTFGPDGASSSASVTAAGGCAWTASSEVSWIALSTSAGSGDGTVRFAVSAFSGSQPRTGQMTIAGRALTVTQTACSVQVSSSDVNVDASAGQSVVSITTAGSCGWTIDPDASWITADPSSGTGPANVALKVAENRDDRRDGRVKVNERLVTVHQASAACRTALSLSPSSFSVAGGSALLHVDARPGCAWRVAAAADWLTLGATSGQGAANMTVAAAPNLNVSARRIAITTDDARLDVGQSGQGECAYKLAFVRRLVPLAGEAGGLEVATSPGCAWTAASSAPSVLMLSPTTQQLGSGSVTYQLGRNPDEGYVTGFRETAIQVRWAAPSAGENAWLWQFGDCRAAFFNLPAVIPALGGTYRLSFYAESPFSCPWRVEGSAPWLQITARSDAPTPAPQFPASPVSPNTFYQGDGEVFFTATPNPGATRSVTIIVAEKPVTVTQPGVGP